MIHVLLTRTPLYSQDCSCFLVRLACVKRAASVDSEPGSNSRLNRLAGGTGRQATEKMNLSREWTRMNANNTAVTTLPFWGQDAFFQRPTLRPPTVVLDRSSLKLRLLTNFFLVVTSRPPTSSKISPPPNR